MKILVDGSNMWYRAYCSTFLERPSGPVLIATYMLRRLCKEYGKKNIIICWDDGTSGRKDLDSEYKADRKVVEGVWEDLAYMKAMINCLGLSTAYYPEYEADDVIGSLAKNNLSENRIVSYDKDFYQLVDDKISILRPERTVKGNKIPQQIINRMEVIEEFGCPPEKVVLYKSFRGDASDNIPKIGIRFTKAFSNDFYQVILQSATIDEFYSKIGVFDEKYCSELLAFKERAKINFKILQIKTNLPIQIVTSDLNADRFNNLCKELAIIRLKFSDWEIIDDEAPAPAPIQTQLF